MTVVLNVSDIAISWISKFKMERKSWNENLLVLFFGEDKNDDIKTIFNFGFIDIISIILLIILIKYVTIN